MPIAKLPERIITTKSLHHQAELPLTNDRVLESLPEPVKTECRQLISQLLQEVLRAEKEVAHEL
jgi:hypothetical protein